MAKIVRGGKTPQVDVEKVRYCDNLKDGTKKEFLRCFVYKDGVLTETNDYEIDGTTAYLVEGEVTRCTEEQKVVFQKYLFKKGIIPIGVTEEYWDSNGNGVGDISSSAANTQPIDEIFTQTDECGILQHENDPDSVTVIPQAIPTDPGDVNLAHQSCLDFWICISEEDAARGVQVSARTNGFSSAAVYFGTCNGKLKLVNEFIRNTTFAGANFFNTDLGTLGAGFFHVRIYSHDPGTFGKTSLQWSFDNGATFEDIPTENLISKRPSAFCTTVTCDDEGKLYFASTGEEILEDDYKCFSCDPCNIPSGLPEAGADEDHDVEVIKLCDKALTGEITKFLRHYTYVDGILTSQVDTLLDGTAYNPSGIVSDCEKDCSSSCAYWNQTFSVGDGAIGQLELQDGNGDYCAPNCAKVSIIKGNGVFTYHENGTPGSDVDGDFTGHPVFECDTIDLGCCGCNGGSADELKNFKITPFPGETLLLSVTYSRPK